MNDYTANTLIQMKVTVTTSTGTLVDPTTLVFKMTTPDGLVSDYTVDIVNTGVGKNYVNFLAAQIGLHRYEWIGTGAAQVSAVGQFIVDTGTF